MVTTTNCTDTTFGVNTDYESIRYPVSMTEPGRRERKKAATRKAISDAATALFVEHGFDEVSVREVADKADVSPTTVFAHFPQKEALVFDEDDEIREKLVAVVRRRVDGVSISDSLRRALIAWFAEDEGDDHETDRARFIAMIEATPALRDYSARMWARNADALADAIAAETGRTETDDATRLFAHLAVQVQIMAMASDSPVAVIETGFAMLADGWSPERPTAPR